MAIRTQKNDLDFDDVDFEFDLENDGSGEFRSTKKKSKGRKAIEDLSGGFLSGMRAKVFSKETQRKFVKDTLPGSYSSAFESATDAASGLGDLYDTAYNGISDVTDKASRKVKPLLDRYDSKLPNRIRRPLQKWAQNSKPLSKFTQQDRDELEAVQIVNDVFTSRTAVNVAKSQAAAAKAHAQLTGAGNDLLHQLVVGQHRQISYQDQIDVNYKKKSLELQYRQFYTQRKTLDTLEKTLSLQEEAFKDIVKNTALPDYVKMTSMEFGKKALLENLIGKQIHGGWGRNSNGLIGKMIGSVKSNLQRDLRNLGTNVSEVLETLGEDNSDLEMGPKRSAGYKAAKFATDNLLSDIIMSKATDAFNKKFGNNPLIRKGGKKLNNVIGKTKSKLGDWAAHGSDNPIMDFIIGYTGLREHYAGPELGIHQGDKDKLEDAAYFDILTRKSITEIIPGYLSRMHWELQAIRTGDTNHSRLAYDFTKSSFSREKVMRNKLADDVLNENNSRVTAIHQQLSNVLKLDELDDEEVKHAFLKQMTVSALNGTGFDLHGINSPDDDDLAIFKNRHKTKFSEFLRNKHGFVEQEDQGVPLTYKELMQSMLTGIRNSKDSWLLSEEEVDDKVGAMYAAMNDLKNQVSNPMFELRDFARTGQLDILRDIGITDNKEGGATSLSLPNYVEAIMKGRTTNEFGGLSKNTNEDTVYFINGTTTTGKEYQKSAATDDVVDWSKTAAKWRKSGANATDRQNSSLFSREVLMNQFSKGGYTGKYGESTPVGIVHGDEYVFNAEDVKRIGLENIENFKYQAANKVKEAKGKITDSDLYQKAEKVIDEYSLNPAEYSQRTKEALDNLMNRVRVVSGGTFTPSNLRKALENDPTARDLMSKYIDIRSAVRVKAGKLSFEDTLESVDNVIGKVQGSNIFKAIKDKEIGGKIDSALSLVSALAGDLKGTAGYKLNDLKGIGLKPKDKNADNWQLELAKDVGTTALNAAMAFASPAKSSFKFAGALGKLGAKMIGKSVSQVKNFSGVVHALWVKGDKEPKLLATKLQQGHYINSDGNVITKPNEIIGDIYDSTNLDEHGNPALVLAEKEYTGGLFDARGKLFFKPARFIGKMVGKLVKPMTKLAVNTFVRLPIWGLKKYFQITMWPGKVALDLMTKAISDPKGDVHTQYLAQSTYLNVSAQAETTQAVGGLTQMLSDIFKDKEHAWNDLNKDGTRDGDSISNLAARRKEKEEERKRKAEKKAQDQANKKIKDGKDKESFLGKIFDKVMGFIPQVGTALTAGLSALTRFVGPAIGIVLGGIVAKMGIKSLLGWLAGKDTVDPNDPRLNPNSPQYDPELAQRAAEGPGLVSKAAQWGLEKVDNMGMLGTATLGAGAYYGGKYALGKAAGAAGTAGKAAWGATKAGAAIMKSEGVKAGGKVIAKKAAQRAIATKVGGFIAKRAGIAAATSLATSATATAATGVTAAAAGAGIGSTIMGGLAAAGTAIAGVMTAPVTLGILAAAAVAGIGYLAYKRYKKVTEQDYMFRLRMASYGVDYKDEDLTTRILTIEEYFSKHAKRDRNSGRMSLGDTLEEDKVLQMFGVTRDDEAKFNDWKNYYMYRFLPIWAIFTQCFHDVTKSFDITKMDEQLSFADMRRIIPEVLWKDGRTEHNPYDIMTSGFIGLDRLEVGKSEVHELFATISKRLEVNVKSGKENDKLKAGQKEKNAINREQKAHEKKQEAAAKTREATAKATGTSSWMDSIVNGASNMAKGAWDSISKFGKGLMDGLSDMGKTLTDGFKSMLKKFSGGGGEMGGGGAGGSWDGTTTNFNGELIGTPQGGTYRDVPASSGVGWAANKATIVKAALIVGVDAGLAAAMAAQESGFNPTIKASSSSATGLFQFISSTWSSMMQQYASKFGIPNGTRPTDARANALLGCQFIRDNIVALSAIGRVQPGDAYLAHFAGLGGAKRVLRAGDSAPITRGFDSSAISANPGIFNGTRNLGDVRRKLTSLMVEKHRALGVDIPIGGGTVSGGDAASTGSTSSGGSTGTSAPTGSNAISTAVQKAATGTRAGTNGVLAPTANSKTYLQSTQIMNTPVRPRGSSSYGDRGMNMGVAYGADLTIYVKRYWEGPSSRGGPVVTLAKFHCGWIKLEGHILEPEGPDTTASGRNKRIPAGTYNLLEHNGSGRTNVVKLYNANVPASRSILFHEGTTRANTEGCLLVGDGFSQTKGLLNSNVTTSKLLSEIKKVGVSKVKVVITNEFAKTGTASHLRFNLNPNRGVATSSGNANFDSRGVGHKDFNGQNRAGTGTVLAPTAGTSYTRNSINVAIDNATYKKPDDNHPAVVAARFVSRHCRSSSIGKCAKYWADGYVHAGFKFTRLPSAYMYANGTMDTMGFVKIAKPSVTQIGDVVVWPAHGGKGGGGTHGHIEVWDGSGWCSDFKHSRHRPGPGYDRVIGQETYWRHKDLLNGVEATGGTTAYGEGDGESTEDGPKYRFKSQAWGKGKSVTEMKYLDNEGHYKAKEVAASKSKSSGKSTSTGKSNAYTGIAKEKAQIVGAGLSTKQIVDIANNANQYSVADRHVNSGGAISAKDYTTWGTTPGLNAELAKEYGAKINARFDTGAVVWHANQTTSIPEGKEYQVLPDGTVVEKASSSKTVEEANKPNLPLKEDSLKVLADNPLPAISEKEIRAHQAVHGEGTFPTHAELSAPAQQVLAEQTRKQVEVRANEQATQELIKSATQQANVEIADGNTILREQLKVQTQMLSHLASIDKHIVGTGKQTITAINEMSKATTTAVTEAIKNKSDMLKQQQQAQKLSADQQHAKDVGVQPFYSLGGQEPMSMKKIM